MTLINVSPERNEGAGFAHFLFRSSDGDGPLGAGPLAGLMQMLLLKLMSISCHRPQTRSTYQQMG